MNQVLSNQPLYAACSVMLDFGLWYKCITNPLVELKLIPTWELVQNFMQVLALRWLQFTQRLFCVIIILAILKKLLAFHTVIITPRARNVE